MEREAITPASSTLGAAPAGLGARLSQTGVIAAAIALAVAIVLALFGSLAWRDRAQTFREAELLAGTLAAVLAEHAGRLFETSDFVLKQAVRLAGPAGRPLPRDRRTQGALVELAATAPYVVAIWLGDAEGDAVLTSRQFPAPRLNARDRAFYWVPRDDPGALYLGLLSDNRYRDEVLINMSRRVAPIDGPFRGFVQVAVSPDYIRALYDAIDIGYDRVLWLLGPKLEPLLREPNVPSQELLAAGTAGAFAPALAAERGVFRAPGPIENQVERLFAFHRVPNYEAHVVVGIDVQDVLARWHDRLFGYVWSGLAGILGILGLGHVAWQRARQGQAFAQALERRVQERTIELEAAKRRLEETLARKQVLLREVDHRTKNSLQLVSGLLRLQERREEDPRVLARLAEARRRVATIAKVHARLHQTDRVEAVAMGAYLEELCRDLAASLPGDGHAGEILVEAEEIELPTDMVVPLALIVNELVTNACKYAYPPDAAGVVRVVFRADGPRLRLEVLDGGRGLPPGFDPAGSEGMGMRIVATLVQQLGGRWHAEPASPGTRFVVEVPRPGSGAQGSQAQAETGSPASQAGLASG